MKEFLAVPEYVNEVPDFQTWKTDDRNTSLGLEEYKYSNSNVREKNLENLSKKGQISNQSILLNFPNLTTLLVQKYVSKVPNGRYKPRNCLPKFLPQESWG